MNKGLREATLWWQSPEIAWQSQGDHTTLANHIDGELSSPSASLFFHASVRVGEQWANPPEGACAALLISGHATLNGQFWQGRAMKEIVIFSGELRRQHVRVQSYIYMPSVAPPRTTRI